MLPALAEGYIEPTASPRPRARRTCSATERWWRDAAPAAVPDFRVFALGQLTGPEATERPPIILGQPGSGKSVLIRRLATTRLAEADFLLVRVKLRTVCWPASPCYSATARSTSASRP